VPAQLVLTPFHEVAHVAAGLEADIADSLLQALQPLPRTLITGQGRSGLVGRAFAHRLMHLGVDSHVVGDVTCPAVVEDDLMVLISGSGTTSTTVRQARIARKVGATVATVTAVADSELSAQADTRLVVPVDAAVSCQFASTLFSQCVQLIFDGICMQLADTWRREHGYLYARHSNLE
jgi:6-phospho-3-hexuloisomerase